MIINTGRVNYHWHGGQMTRRPQGLMGIYNSTLVEINPDDAIRMKIVGNNRIRITSRRVKIEAEALLIVRVPPRMVFANFHFPESSANKLPFAKMDPVAKIPNYKICAVRLEKF